MESLSKPLEFQGNLAKTTESPLKSLESTQFLWKNLGILRNSSSNPGIPRAPNPPAAPTLISPLSLFSQNPAWKSREFFRDSLLGAFPAFQDFSRIS